MFLIIIGIIWLICLPFAYWTVRNSFVFNGHIDNGYKCVSLMVALMASPFIVFAFGLCFHFPLSRIGRFIGKCLP